MNNKITNLINITTTFMKNHSPEILTGLGICGMITGTVLAVKATPLALELIEERKKINNKELTKMEIISAAWKPYIPAGICLLSSSICFIGVCSVNHRRNAALSAAYTLSEKTFSNYRDQVIKTLGEKKEKKIKDEIAQKQINDKPIDANQVIITNKGQTLCLDSISGRYFKSDLDIIRKVTNDINKRLLTDNYISLNEYYSMIGLDHIKDGWNIGWNIDKGYLDPSFSACITKDDQPCIVIDYNITPTHDYNKF